jgi:hypothetical protein
MGNINATIVSIFSFGSIAIVKTVESVEPSKNSKNNKNILKGVSTYNPKSSPYNNVFFLLLFFY